MRMRYQHCPKEATQPRSSRRCFRVAIVLLASQMVRSCQRCAPVPLALTRLAITRLAITMCLCYL